MNHTVYVRLPSRTLKDWFKSSLQRLTLGPFLQIR